MGRVPIPSWTPSRGEGSLTELKGLSETLNPLEHSLRSHSGEPWSGRKAAVELWRQVKEPVAAVTVQEAASPWPHVASHPRGLACERAFLGAVSSLPTTVFPCAPPLM